MRYDDIVRFLKRYFDILSQVSLILRYQEHNVRQLRRYADKMTIDITILYRLISLSYDIMTAFSPPPPPPKKKYLYLKPKVDKSL